MSTRALMPSNLSPALVASFPLSSLLVHEPCGPSVTLPASSGPSAQVYSRSSPNLSLDLHHTTSTVTSHPAPALLNQGKHQHTTVINHLSQPGVTTIDPHSTFHPSRRRRPATGGERRRLLVCNARLTALAARSLARSTPPSLTSTHGSAPCPATRCHAASRNQ